MIEGLKVTVLGTELKSLCLARAEYHIGRVETYSQQLKSFTKAEIEAASFTGGDPTRALQQKLDEHTNQAAEMRFIADHLKLGEEYLLDWDALCKLGITKTRY